MFLSDLGKRLITAPLAAACRAQFTYGSSTPPKFFSLRRWGLLCHKTAIWLPPSSGWLVHQSSYTCPLGSYTIAYMYEMGWKSRFFLTSSCLTGESRALPVAPGVFYRRLCHRKGGPAECQSSSHGHVPPRDVCGIDVCGIDACSTDVCCTEELPTGSAKSVPFSG